MVLQGALSQYNLPRPHLHLVTKQVLQGSQQAQTRLAYEGYQHCLLYVIFGRKA